MQKSLAWVLGISAAVMAVALGLISYLVWHQSQPPVLRATYHAVLIGNGQAFFGRVQSLDTDYLVLQDVYYIQSRQNPETKQVSNMLVKRGQEWHSPDRMILNRRHVVLLEPVTENSQVAKLIAEQAKHGPLPPAVPAPATK
jgi:hypothetical protein